MPTWIASLLVLSVALIQAAIAVAEIFLWKLPMVHSRIGYLPADAAIVARVAPIVANAGLYNSFLAAGLVWGLLATGCNAQIQSFFLLCVIVAGIFGAATLRWTTLLIQSAPALIALLALRST